MGRPRGKGIGRMGIGIVGVFGGGGLARRFHAEPQAYQRKMAQRCGGGAQCWRINWRRWLIISCGMGFYEPEKLFGSNRAGAESLKGGLAKSHET
jgi:hypothetical protein